MKIQDSKSNTIKTITDWSKLFLANPKKKKHWKEGRSAFELANFILNKNGENYLIDLISNMLREKISFEKAIPELETRFDKYNHGREHDLGIWGTTDSGKSIFVGVEAKVDEEFNNKIFESYIAAKTKELNGEKTNAPKRIEKLIERSFEKVQRKHWNLMYQLFYTLFGTIDALNNGKKSDIPIMLVIVFKSNLFNDVKGKDNHKEYTDFIKEFLPEQIFCEDKNTEIHKLIVEKRIVYSVYLEL